MKYVEKIMLLSLLVVLITASFASAQQIVVGFGWPVIVVVPPPPMSTTPYVNGFTYGPIDEPIYGYVPPECYPFHQAQCRQYYNRPIYHDDNHNHYERRYDYYKK
jgi:hypothetical protein